MTDELLPVAAAVIPTIGASEYLMPLVNTLAEVLPLIILIDNRPEHRPIIHDHQHRLDRACEVPQVRCYRRPDQNIYRTWNSGMDTVSIIAHVIGATPICHVLNDDVVLTHDAIVGMTDWLAKSDWAILGYDYRSQAHGGAETMYPVPVHGTYRKGGVGGFAFAVNPDRCARAHEGFRWWGGDDDLMYATTEIGGKVGVLVGCHVSHPQPSLTASTVPLEDETWAAHDKALLLERWGETW